MNDRRLIKSLSLAIIVLAGMPKPFLAGATDAELSASIRSTVVKARLKALNRGKTDDEHQAPLRLRESMNTELCNNNVGNVEAIGGLHGDVTNVVIAEDIVNICQ